METGCCNTSYEQQRALSRLVRLLTLEAVSLSPAARRSVRRATFSAYLDCRMVGAGDEAVLLLRLVPPSDAAPENDT